jgi:hypothetical protein
VKAAEHFARAEDFAKDAEAADLGSPGERYCLDMAQVHATLAVAASQMRSLPAEQAGKA